MTKNEAVEQCARNLCKELQLDEADFQGMTFREILEDCEQGSGEAMVFWSCWDQQDLYTIPFPFES